MKKMGNISVLDRSTSPLGGGCLMTRVKERRNILGKINTYLGSWVQGGQVVRYLGGKVEVWAYGNRQYRLHFWTKDVR